MEREYELYHYGVKGMKWGVRTKYRTGNAIGGSYSTKQKKKMSKKAVKVIEKERRRDSKYAELYERAAQKNKNKGQNDKAKQNSAIAKTYLKKAKLNEMRISQIESGKLKAGKDFVVNSEYSTNLLLDAAGLINIRSESRVEFK